MEKESIEQPKPAAPGWLLENITEASKNARKIYLLYLGVLAYIALTVVSTTDRQIVLNEPAILPIIKVPVSLIGFFILAPWLAIMVFIYFQLYLNRLKKLSDRLHKEHPREDRQKIYPWIINFAGEQESGFVGFIQRFMVTFSLWWSLPLVLMLLSAWYIKKHDPLWSYIIGVLPVIGTFFVIKFWSHYRSEKFSLKRISTYAKFILASFVIIFEIVLFRFIIPQAFEGERFLFFKHYPCVDLSYQKLINEENEAYETLYWANLQGAHLKGANLEGAILKKADLRHANLGGANLLGTNLRKARLDSAHLEGANIRYANLEDAVLEFAHLEGADLMWVNLDGTDLWGADLRGAINLTLLQFQETRTLYNAQLDSALLNSLRKHYHSLFKHPLGQ
jgi:hypothetical protein